MAHYWVATLDHSGVLDPSDLREAGHCLWFGSLAQAEGFLADYAQGRTSMVATVAGDAEWREGAGYGATRGEDGPMLTLWSAPSDDSLASWRELAADHDAYPDRRMSIGPRGGVVCESC